MLASHHVSTPLPLSGALLSLHTPACVCSADHRSEDASVDSLCAQRKQRGYQPYSAKGVQMAQQVSSSPQHMLYSRSVTPRCLLLHCVSAPQQTSHANH
jgi:hypothetical protein